MKQLKIGIISDLHCHNKAKNNGLQESYLLTDVNLEISQDPFKSFEKLITEEKTLTVDILLMPGDFANKSDKDGLIFGWEITKKIAILLKSKFLIPNVGNHDVDSRKILSNDPFELIKNFDKDFPFADEKANSSFWSKGYLLIEKKDYRILVVNTVHSHTSKEMADKGLISQESINELERELSLSKSNKVSIALCHHNPIEHSHYDTGSTDFMHNGDEMITLLDKFGFDLIIHGHKHDPRIRYSQGGANSPTIFSSGSFSAFKNLQLQGANNTFHIITLECNNDQIGRGIIDTWFFVPTKGWTKQVKNNFFEPRIGFGAKIDIKKIAIEILDWFKGLKTMYLEWEKLIEQFPDLQYLIPSDLEKLKNDLKNKNILISPYVYGEPIFVQYKPTQKKNAK